MARYIDADKLDFSPLEDGFDRARAVTIVKFAPTADVVEVVRCKDCKYYCLSDFRRPEEERWCEQICNGNYYPEPTDFCSYGERTMIDNKEYARQLRTNAAKDENGVIRCSPELWEEIARIIENSEEVKHGQWKHCEEPLGWQDVDVAVCSVCGEEWMLDEWDIEEFSHWNKFCSSCGAKMDGRKDE